MRVDAIALKLRPRSMWEATDLGVRLMQSHMGAVWRCCAPVYAVVLVLAFSTFEIAPWLPACVIFWLKPWLDRSVLFVLSRAVFGQSTRLADLWHAQRSVWWGQLASTLTLRRLSPWRSFTQPAWQLEGQSGAARRQRRTQLMRNQRGAASWMHLAFAHAEAFLVFAGLSLAVWFLPENSRPDLFKLLAGTADGAMGSSLAYGVLYAAVVALLEPFYVAAGFAMYLNRRVQLEAWDIEQEFRRAF